MRQRSLARSTRRSKVMSAGSVESQYLVGSFSPLGHSISNHSSPRSWRPRAARARTRAKREESRPAVPSRQPIVRQARLGRPNASALTERGLCLALRRGRVGGRPRPDHRLGGNGCVLPGAHTVVLDRKSTRLNSSHSQISYAVFCLKKKISITNHS